MADSTFLSLSLCFLVFLHGCFAQIEPVTTQPRGFPPQQRQQRPQRDECQLDRISAVEPNRRIQSEAGVTDVWDENDDQFQCAGRGVQGVVFPGCPETFQSSESQSHSQYGQSGRQSQRDQHQKVRQIREGDVLALPTGVAQWVYNDGRNPLVLVQVIDTNNPANQLDQNHRVFFVAGTHNRYTEPERRIREW
ncbi:hypothetical protein GH714_004739 [Hevea brasiliensis]|uniref:Cupin type-1 domain-containing protein n=1 Tax=Hevea brasiliensis TaxID=3981 RepID=A0A6A6K9D0_HEVBR|nr:hypothetical protein GH714_004739 [Hevea brasiliensis]